jgi:hypothetical protein
MNIVFTNDCAADGCYKKNKGKGSQLCKNHQLMYDIGVSFKGFYGKTVLKKEFQKPKEQTIETNED